LGFFGGLGIKLVVGRGMIGHFPLHANAKKASCFAGSYHLGLSGAALDPFDPEEIAAISHASTQITALVRRVDNGIGPRPVQLPDGIVMVTNRCIGSSETAADRSGLLKMPGCAEFMHLPFYLSRDRNFHIAAGSHPLACQTDVPSCCANSPLTFPHTMRLLSWICFFLVAFAIQGTLSPLHADEAKNLFKQGRQAELREDYITAYQDYRQAWLAKPKDMEYKEAYTRLRFQAAAQYVEMAKKLRDQGQLNDALTDYLRALEIDPTYEEARQEADRLRARINGSAPQADLDQSGVTSPTSQRELRELGGPLQLKPLSDVPMTIHMVADTKEIYKTIGKLAGINVLFDPDYTSKRIPIDLDRVTLADALRSVAFVSQTFWRPVTSDTIFVAADTRTKRTELEAQAVQTFYLGNITQANDLNEVLNAVRNLMDTTVKMQAVPSQNAIVMRGTPDQLLLAQKIIDDLDKAKAEVVVDIAVLEVNKDLLRNIGLQLPGSIGVQLQSSTAATTGTTSTTSTTSTTTSTTSTSSGLTLNDLGNLNATNFGISIGAATLNMLLTDSDTRVLQNPQIRAVDGEKANLKIGSRVPIATGSFSPGAGIAAAGISPLVSTQFSYIDVGVQIEMTPTIHYDDDVSMKLHIIVSNITSYSNLGGIEQPVIGNQEIQQTIRMKEGSANLLGGILQHSQSLTVGGTPGLGEIPLLKYLFSSQQTETVNDEIVFVLIPHLVRGIDLSPLNLRTIDTGTGTNVSLREVPQTPDVSSALITRTGHSALTFEPSTPPMGAAEAANQAVSQMAQNAESAGEGPAPAGPSSPMTLSFTPQQSVHKVGTTFQMQMDLTGGHDVFSVPTQLHYDPKVLELINVDTGDLLAKDGQTTATVHRDEGNGDVTISTSRPPGVKGITGNGNLCTLTFLAKAPGDATIQVTKAAARNSAQSILPVLAGSPAIVHVQ
jgi:general secretion pathway protein D